METNTRESTPDQAGWNVYNDQCPTRLVLGRIADKWTVMIVGRLARDTLRFGQLRREIAGISQKMLTQALRGLERDGLIARKVFAEVPPRVEYSLTPLGRTLVTVLDQIRGWAESNIDSVLRAQKVFDEIAEGKPTATKGAKVVRLSSRTP
jgi:DNA-binding HxlR family transcriptional regulator